MEEYRDEDHCIAGFGSVSNRHNVHIVFDVGVFTNVEWRNGKSKDRHSRQEEALLSKPERGLLLEPGLKRGPAGREPAGLHTPLLVLNARLRAGVGLGTRLTTLQMAG
jgi:hypothetical protein